ncbi:uncharacterized protein DS421_3g65440 [Arachis hypogaea]|nr:uncharacterized protein DS421_3g65440 [Arachis hypogaea]
MESLDNEKILRHIAIKSSVIEEHVRRIETLLLLLVIGVALVIFMNMFSLFR